jgi:hypothetical protein
VIPERTSPHDPELCKHGYTTYTDAAGRVHIPTGGRCSDVPVPPDAARDARVAARRAADATKAGRALDRLLDAREDGKSQAWQMDARDRFIEEVGDYVLSRLQHNRHYVGVPSGPGEVRLVPDPHYVPHYVRPDQGPIGSTGPLHDTCMETTSHAELAAGTRSWICGQDCQRPPHPYVAGDDFLCVRCGGLESDARHG